MIEVSKLQTKATTEYVRGVILYIRREVTKVVNFRGDFEVLGQLLIPRKTSFVSFVPVEAAKPGSNESTSGAGFVDYGLEPFKSSDSQLKVSR